MVTLFLSIALLVPTSELNTDGDVSWICLENAQDKKDKDKEPTLKFSKDGAEVFAAGKKLFEEKKFKEAREIFKQARKVAKGRPTKLVVGQWTAASEGAILLRRTFLPQFELGNYKQTWNLIEQRYAYYEGTAIQEQYDELRKRLREKLFYVLDDFEVKTGRFSKEHGKTFVQDPEFVKQGRRALKWETVDKPSELKIKKVPRNMTKYEAVSFWIYFPKGGMDYTINFMGGGKSNTGGGRLTSNGFQVNMKPPKRRGWRREEVSFKKFTKFGNVEWESIKDFRIRFKANKLITCYVDDVSLVKK